MDLDSYKWTNRLLVVNSSAEQGLSVQKKTFAADPAETSDRDLLLLPVSESESELWKKFRFQNGEFKMLLIGKDGTIKQEYLEPTPMGSIYNAIDAMPMRRREMNRK